MKFAVGIVGVLAALFLIVYAVGRALPVSHRATREQVFGETPERLFAIVTDVDAFPQWRSNVTRIERLSPSSGAIDGGARYREHDEREAMTYAVDAFEPPRRFVTRIADPSLPFGGRWTYELASAPNGGTRLRITEDGEVYNPVFRFLSRYVFGHTRTMDTYLADLQQRVGRSS